MPNTTFVDKQTRIEADWCQDMNDFKYVLFDGATTKAEAAQAIGAIRVEGNPTNGQVPTWNSTLGIWEPKTPSGGGGITNPVEIVENDEGDARVVFYNSDRSKFVQIEYVASLNSLRFTNETATRFTFNLQTSEATAGSEATANWTVSPP